MWKNIYYKSAFSLLEIILVVALIAISSGIVAPIYYSAKKNTDLNTVLHTIASSLRRAQLLSMAVYHDDNWGLRIQQGSLIIFKGDSYLNRDLAFDDLVKLSSAISISGLDEIVYSKLYGRPDVNGDIILSLDDKEVIININQLGVVDY